jgi:radical SAM protein with 4Fe4S-binding SPASM domain
MTQLDTARRSDESIVLNELDLFVTMRCNLGCAFCAVGANDAPVAELPLARILEILRESATLGLKDVHFSGGEPTLRDDLEEMVAGAVDLGLHTRVISNGYRLDRGRVAGLKRAGLHELMISVDGLEPTHNAMRGNPHAHQRAIEAVRAGLDLDLATRVSLVARRDNRDDVVPLMRQMADLGVHIFSVFLCSPLGRGARGEAHLTLNAAEWREVCDQVRAAASRDSTGMKVVVAQGFQYSDGPSVDRSQIQGRGTGCATLMDDFDFLILRSDGSLFQCVFFVTHGEPIGNVAHAGVRATLVRARQEARYRSFTTPHDRCVSCRFQEPCGTGCRGYAYLHTGDWLRTDPRCVADAGPDVPAYYPLCPILKLNVRSGRIGGSTEQALAGE